MVGCHNEGFLRNMLSSCSPLLGRIEQEKMDLMTTGEMLGSRREEFLESRVYNIIMREIVKFSFINIKNKLGKVSTCSDKIICSHTRRWRNVLSLIMKLICSMTRYRLG